MLQTPPSSLSKTICPCHPFIEKLRGSLLRSNQLRSVCWARLSVGLCHLFVYLLILHLIMILLIKIRKCNLRIIILLEIRLTHLKWYLAEDTFTEGHVSCTTTLECTRKLNILTQESAVFSLDISTEYIDSQDGTLIIWETEEKGNVHHQRGIVNCYSQQQWKLSIRQWVDQNYLQ